ncbi:MAG: hypothetical protein CMF45_00435 [Legionellales bacterium]|nr:hypothetical protein [Legionellales bacterium]
MNPTTFTPEEIENKSIAFVAPSPQIYEAKTGKEIDSHDLVARVFGSSGELHYLTCNRRSKQLLRGSTADYGSRCDIIFCNYVAEMRCRPINSMALIDRGVKAIVFRLYGNFKDVEFVKQCLQYRRAGLNVLFMRTDMASDDFEYEPLMGTRAVDWLLAFGAKKVSVYGMDFFMSDGNKTDRDSASPSYWHGGYQREFAVMRVANKFGLTISNEQLDWFRKKQEDGLVEMDAIGQQVLDCPPKVERHSEFNSRLYEPEDAFELNKVREGMLYMPQAIIVGNGTSVKRKQHGSVIDQFKEVIRFRPYTNHAHKKKRKPRNNSNRYKRYIGTKTTRMVYNTSYAVCRQFKNENDPETFYMFTFERWSLSRIRKMLIPHLTESNTSAIFVEGNLMKQKVGIDGDKCLSSGMIAILYAIEMFGVCAITGFDFVEGRASDSMHFFEKHGVEEYDHHDLKAEAEIINELKRLGRLRILSEIIESKEANGETQKAR